MSPTIPEDDVRRICAIKHHPIADPREPFRRLEVDVGAKRDIAFDAGVRLLPAVKPARPVFERRDFDPTIVDSFVETSHGRLAVRQSTGQGLPILLLHGNSSSKDVFEAQFRSPLGQAHKLIALDLPGHGESSDAPEPAESYTLPGYTDAVAQTLEALGIESLAVVGWSLGGHVAFELMASFPGIVGAMIVGAPPAPRSLEALQTAFLPHPLAAMAGMEELTDEQIAQFAAAAAGPGFAAGLEPLIRRTDGRCRSLLMQSLMTGHFTDERQLVETSSIPVAIVNGAEDPLVNQTYIEGIAYANLWGGRCNVIPRVGHAPFIEAATIFNTLLANFANDMQRLAQQQLDSPALTYSA